MAFPVKELTQEEYDSLPLLESVSIADREKMEIGFKFKFKPTMCSECKQVKRRTICEVVKPLDAITEQVGGGMLSIGSKFINRYCAKIVQK